MDTDETKSTSPNPVSPPTSSNSLKPTAQPQETESRLQDLTEMVAALRARRQASLRRWTAPQ